MVVRCRYVVVWGCYGGSRLLHGWFAVVTWLFTAVTWWFAAVMRWFAAVVCLFAALHGCLRLYMVVRSLRGGPPLLHGDSLLLHGCSRPLCGGSPLLRGGLWPLRGGSQLFSYHHGAFPSASSSSLETCYQLLRRLRTSAIGHSSYPYSDRNPRTSPMMDRSSPIMFMQAKWWRLLIPIRYTVSVPLFLFLSFALCHHYRSIATTVPVTNQSLFDLCAVLDLLRNHRHHTRYFLRNHNSCVTICTKAGAADRRNGTERNGK